MAACRNQLRCAGPARPVLAPRSPRRPSPSDNETFRFLPRRKSFDAKSTRAGRLTRTTTTTATATTATMSQAGSRTRRESESNHAEIDFTFRRLNANHTHVLVSQARWTNAFSIRAAKQLVEAVSHWLPCPLHGGAPSYRLQLKTRPRPRRVDYH